MRVSKKKQRNILIIYTGRMVHLNKNGKSQTATIQMYLHEIPRFENVSILKLCEIEIIKELALTIKYKSNYDKGELKVEFKNLYIRKRI